MFPNSVEVVLRLLGVVVLANEFLLLVFLILVFRTDTTFFTVFFAVFFFMIFRFIKNPSYFGEGFLRFVIYAFTVALIMFSAPPALNHSIC